MSIPLNFSPLGFAQVSVPAEPSELPAGYTRLEFLGTTGTQYVDTGLSFGSETLLSVDAAVIKGSSYSLLAAILAGSYYYSGAALTVTVARGYHDVNTRWDGQVSNNNRFYVKFGADKILASNSANGLIINGVTDKTWQYKSWESDAGDSLWVCAARSREDVSRFAAQNARFYAAAISNDGTTQADFVPAVNPSGAPGLYDKTRQTFFANAGDGAFTAGIETLKQLQQLASNLPTVTGTPEIKLSLPGEWNGDASANAQLSIITGKGWSTSITYRDEETSTSSSFVLGNRGDGGSALVLWCRAVESEYGNYQDADGVRYYVETCHDIWHPQELSPDDLGYTAVLTLEDYLTERGMTAVVYEEDENFTTN